jgi:hypothetical protein
MTVGRLPNVEGGIQPTLLTTTGDIMYASSASNPARLGIGSTNQVLGVTAGVPAYQASSKSTLTTTGDILYASAANTLQRLGIGSNAQVLTVASGVPSWATPTASTTTLSSVASGSLSGSSTVISGLTQDNLQLIIGDVNVSTSTILRVRVNSNSTSNYFYTVNAIVDTGTYDFNTYLTTSPNNGILVSDGLNVRTGSTNNGFVINFTNCKATGMTYFWFSSRFVESGAATNDAFATGQGYFGVAAQVTSLEIYLSTGSFSGGTYKVIGG